MKKVMSLVLFVVLFSTAALAVTPNPVATTSTGTQANVNYEGQSNFGAIGAWGNTVAGNPGYLMLKGCDSANACFPYYLWIASDGKLYVASYITISAFTSFPSGSWNRNNMAVGTTIGSQ